VFFLRSLFVAADVGGKAIRGDASTCRPTWKRVSRTASALASSIQTSASTGSGAGRRILLRWLVDSGVVTSAFAAFMGRDKARRRRCSVGGLGGFRVEGCRSLVVLSKAFTIDVEVRSAGTEARGERVREEVLSRAGDACLDISRWHGSLFFVRSVSHGPLAFRVTGIKCQGCGVACLLKGTRCGWRWQRSPLVGCSRSIIVQVCLLD
jgi:hypothetical protein